MGLIYIHTTIYKVDNQLLYNTGNYPQYFVITYKPSNDGSVGKISVCNAGDTRDMGSIPGKGRSPGEGNGNHFSILAWEIPWTEETGGPQSMGSQSQT